MSAQTTVLSRWKARRAVRYSLLRHARAAFDARKTKANLARLREREAQVAQADRVIARHTPHTPGVSGEGVALIAEFEGCILRPYRDAVGVWTIGYGHTEHVGPHSPALPSKQAALELLHNDLDHKYAPPVARLGVPLNQHQFDALVSLSYNLGPGILGKGHTLGAALARRDYAAAANAILLYDYAGGRKLAGLTRRRRAERALFVKPV